MKKTKSIISVLLALTLVFALCACSASNGKQQQTTTQTQTAIAETSKETTTQAEQTTTQEQTTTTTTQPTTAPKIKTKSVKVDALFFQTSDWNDYQATQYKGKSECTVTMEIPEKYSCESTIIYNEKSIKCAEVVGLMVLKDGQSAFDKTKLNDPSSDIIFTKKETGKLSNGTPYTLISGTAPTELGDWYIYDYALDYGEYSVIITMYSFTKLNDALINEYDTILSSVTVK